MNTGAKRLTVLAIESREFPRRIRGYDSQAVRAFLQEVSVHYEEILTENHRLREDQVSLREEVERFRTLENTLKESLLLAQKSADETRHNAHKEAELILKEAHMQADNIELEAQQKIAHLSSQIEHLQSRRRSLITEMRVLLQSHIQSLEYFEASDNGKTSSDEKAVPDFAAVVEARE
jgi:cell division initiation protein